MTNTEVKIIREYKRQPEAVNYFETKKENYFIKLVTSKRGQGLSTLVHAVEKTDGFCESFVMYQDYAKVIKHEATRATESAIKQAQQSVIAQIDKITNEFNNHYKIN